MFIFLFFVFASMIKEQNSNVNFKYILDYIASYHQENPDYWKDPQISDTSGQNIVSSICKLNYPHT